MQNEALTSNKSGSNADTNESSNKLEPTFVPDLPNKRSPKHKIYWRLTACALITLLALSLFLVILYEAIIPPMTQKVIDNAELKLEKVQLLNPTETGFDLEIEAVLMRDNKIAAFMHGTSLDVFVKDPNAKKPEETVETSDSLRRLGAGRRMQEQTATHPVGEILLGTLLIPEMHLSGYETPMKLSQTFNVSSLKAFDAFAVALIREGQGSWHLLGSTVVSVLGKTVNNLNFDKTLSLEGPSFMQPEGIVESKQVVPPAVTGIAADPRADGSLDVSVNMTVSNPGKTAMDPLGAVVFEISWSGVLLGNLETKSISIFPGSNDLEMFGIWNLNEGMKGLSFFELVKVAKLLNELRLMAKNGDSVVLRAVGLSSTTPLYDAAVKAIDAEFKIDNFNLDLMGDDGSEDDEKPDSEPAVNESMQELIDEDNGTLVEDVVDGAPVPDVDNAPNAESDAPIFEDEARQPGGGVLPQEVPANEVPVNEVPVNEVPVNEVPVNEVPANEVPANEVPANEVPANEVPANEVPANEVPANEVPANEVPANEVPANEVPANEVPANEVPANEVPANEFPANEFPANEFPANEFPANEFPANEVPANEVPANEVLANEAVDDGSFVMDTPYDGDVFG